MAATPQPFGPNASKKPLSQAPGNRLLGALGVASAQRKTTDTVPWSGRDGRSSLGLGATARGEDSRFSRFLKSSSGFCSDSFPIPASLRDGRLELGRSGQSIAASLRIGGGPCDELYHSDDFCDSQCNSDATHKPDQTVNSVLSTRSCSFCDVCVCLIKT